MKILLVSPLPPPAGGMALWTQQYLEFMNNKNIQVDVVNIAVTGKRAANYTKKNILGEVLRTLNIFKNTLIFAVRGKYGLAHVNTSCSKNGITRDKIVVQILHFFKKKIILQCHCDVRYALGNERSFKAFKHMLKQSDKCLVLNKASRDFIRENFNTEALIVPNFISEEYEAAISAPKRINENIKTALYVGHILATKGCDIIIEAAKQYPQIQFRLVGHVSQKFSEIILPENVLLLGEKDRTQVNEEYKNADVLLFPTHTEGFPLTVIEAMAYGLPIITTRVGAIPDILEDEGALYIPVNSEQALVEAIDKIKDTKCRNDMSSFNREKVKKYLINNVLDELINNIYCG